MCIIYVLYHSVSCTKVYKSSYSNSNCRKSNPNWINKRPCETWLNYQPCSTNQLLHRSILLFAYPDPSFSGVAHITKIFSGATLRNLKKKKDSRITPSCTFAKTSWSFIWIPWYLPAKILSLTWTILNFLDIGFPYWLPLYSWVSLRSATWLRPPLESTILLVPRWKPQMPPTSHP